MSAAAAPDEPHYLLLLLIGYELQLETSYFVLSDGPFMSNDQTVFGYFD